MDQTKIYECKDAHGLGMFKGFGGWKYLFIFLNNHGCGPIGLKVHCSCRWTEFHHIVKLFKQWWYHCQTLGNWCEYHWLSEITSIPFKWNDLRA